jgi:cation:H+ antiporter
MPAARSDEPRRAARGPRIAILAAVATTIPGLAVRVGGATPPSAVAAALFGLAVVGSAFLLAWAAEVLQLDVSQGLALTVLALIAVLPEYAVSFVFAHKAAQDPHTFAPLALANMTGSNRLLIGVGWSLVVLLAAWRMTRIARRRGYVGELQTDVVLERPHAIEITFLALATAYSLTLPLKHQLALYDTVVLVVIFVVFVLRVVRAPAEEPHLVGPALLIATRPPAQRRAAVAMLLAYAAGVIYACADPFAESLVHVGEQAGISTFVLIQWVAPLASEAPELLVAGMFAWRLDTNAGFGTLLSSKVNQWTLLVGTLPVVFWLSGGSSHGLPLTGLERQELFLTAAQSVFAIAVVASRSVSVRETITMFSLFMLQFVLGGVLPESLREWERLSIAILYLLLAVAILIRQRRFLRPLARDGLRVPVRELFHESSESASV